MKTQEPVFFVLQADAEIKPFVQAFPNSENRVDQLVLLARALANNLSWVEMPDAVIVVRTAPQPLLGFMGYFDSAAQLRIEALRWQLQYVLPRLRYVDYHQTEEDCARLAEKLLGLYGHNELRSFGFTGIPRGGLIVLGMLAYILDVPHENFESSFNFETNAPLVVVDDCALTGGRFASFLKNCPSKRIVFAHLYSHPDLRTALKTQETQVMACLSAKDLKDYAPDNLGPDYPAWRKRWDNRSKQQCYWTGQPEHICFAWNEPDFTVWNPVSRKEENGFHLIPPEHCLKNRNISGFDAKQLQIQPIGNGPIKPSPKVLYGELEEQVIIGHMDSGSALSLTGVAAHMWKAIVKYGNTEDVMAALLKEYEVAPVKLRADLNDFMADLFNRRLIENTDSSNFIA